MKPATALLWGTGALIALFYGKKVLSLLRGDVSVVPIGLKSFFVSWGMLRGGIRMNIINNGTSSFHLNGVSGSVYVDSRFLADAWVDDPAVIAPGITRNVEIDFSVPLTVNAAMTIVRLITGVVQKRVQVTFDAIVQAEGLTIPVKKTFSYG